MGGGVGTSLAQVGRGEEKGLSLQGLSAYSAHLYLRDIKDNLQERVATYRCGRTFIIS
jgi:hypothetical protein